MSRWRQRERREEAGTLLRHMTCTGCSQACRRRDAVSSSISFDEAQRIRFKESEDAAARGEYGTSSDTGYSVRRTRARVLGLLYEDKEAQWQVLIKTCPERIYPPPGEDGPLEFDAKDELQAADVAAAQSEAMEIPLTRRMIMEQLGDEFPSDPDALEGMIVRAYRQAKRERELEGPPEYPEQPDTDDFYIPF